MSMAYICTCWKHKEKLHVKHYLQWYCRYNQDSGVVFNTAKDKQKHGQNRLWISSISNFLLFSNQNSKPLLTQAH